MSEPAILTRTAVLGRGSGKVSLEEKLYFYIKEIELQSEFALRAYGEIVQRVSCGSNDLSMLAFTHMLFVFSGNVSKMFFPTNEKDANLRKYSRERSKRLREILKIDDHSALRMRSHRDHLEHFDARLDRYIGSAVGILFPYLITDQKTQTIRLDDGREFAANHLRCLEKDRMIFTFMDQEVALAPIAEELSRVQGNARSYLKNQKAGI